MSAQDRESWKRREWERADERCKWEDAWQRMVVKDEMAWCSMVSPVGCVRFGEETLATYVLQLVTFGFVLMLDINTFVLKANRALATYKANLLIKTAL